jgi:golgin subfamily B member 1
MTRIRQDIHHHRRPHSSCHHRLHRRTRRPRPRPRPATKWLVAVCFLVKLLVQITEAFLVPRGARGRSFPDQIKSTAFKYNTNSETSSSFFFSAPKLAWASNLFPFRNADDSRQDRKRMSSDVSVQPQQSTDGSVLRRGDESRYANNDDNHSHEPLPSVDDLNQNLDLLRRQLDEKNQRFRETVLNLQKESERTLASVQQWDEYYRTRMDELSSQAAKKAQEESHVTAKGETAVQGLDGSPKEDGSVSNSSSEKVYWLAEQLQRVKSQTQQSQLELELDAKNKELQTRLELVQDELERQREQTESERARYEQLWRYRLALEAEVAEIQAKLQQSIHDLKERLDAEMKERLADKQRHDDEIRTRDETHEEQLRKVRDESNQAVMKLTNDLRAKDSQYSQAVQQIQSSSSLSQAGSEEKRRLEAEQARLAELLQQKERALADQVALAAAAHEKANTQWAKRSELETELANVKREFDAAVREWTTRVDALERTHKSEKEALQRLLTQKESEISERVHQADVASEAKNQMLLQSLKEKDDKYAQVVREIQDASDREKKNLHESVETIRQQLERYRADTDKRLQTEKEAHETKQRELEALLARKEKELLQQSTLSSSVKESALLQRERQQELDRQVSDLKHQHEAEVKGWELRLRAIQQERSSEQLRMEAKLAQAIEKGREEIESLRREAMRRQSELELQLGVKAEAHRSALKKVNDESKFHEVDLKRRLELLSNEYQQYKAESERQLASQKMTHDALTSQLAEKETLYSAQVDLALATESQLQKERELRSELEKTLSSLKSERGVLEKEVQVLRSQVESVSTTLQSNRAKSEEAFKAELEASHRNQNETAAQLLRIEEDLRKQVILTASTEALSRQHWERREELEKELATLKYKHDASIVESEVRIKALEKANQFELQKREAELAATRDKARVEIAEAKNRTVSLERELNDRLAQQEAARQLQRKQLQEALTAKEQDLNAVIHTLSLEIHQLKLESQRQVVAANEAAESSQTALRSALTKTETELTEQKKLAEDAESRALAEIEQRMKLEKELETSKISFENHVAQWESRYHSLFESRNEALQKAESLISRKEVDSRGVIEALKNELEAAMLAHAQSLKDKDQQHASTLEAQRVLSESKLQKVHEQLREVSASYQQLKVETRELVNELSREAAAAKATYTECLKLKEQDFEARMKQIQEGTQDDLVGMRRELQAVLDNHALLKVESSRMLATEREERARTEAELRKVIQQKEVELLEQAALATKFRSTAEELLAEKQRKRRITIQERDDLENELSVLKKKYQSDIARWEAKYAALQEESQERDNQQALTAEKSRESSDSEDKHRTLSLESQLRQRELKSEIQALAVRHVMEIQEVEEAAKFKEDELSKKLRSLQETLQNFESKAHEALEQEKRASLLKQESLVAQIEQSQRHLEKVLELYAQEKGKKKS